MVTCFPFVHDGDFHPIYCAIYNDNYSWRLGKIEYSDPDNISIFVTADSIKRSAYDTALHKMMKDEINIDLFFRHVDFPKSLSHVNLNDDEFADFYISAGRVRNVPQNLPHSLIQFCNAILQVVFTRRKKFCLEKVECIRTDI